MSRETSEWLNQNTLIGFTDKRGHAWHYRASDQGAEPNHYPGAIPVADVERRLFAWQAVPLALSFTIPGTDGMPDLSMPIDGRKVWVRNDTYSPLGIFTDGYVGHQYDKWLLGAVSNILGDSLSVGSAGQLKGGAVAWVSVEVPDTITTPEGVAFRPNLLACTSFDGSLATTYKRVVTNVVCDNTMAAGLSEAGQAYKVKHSRYSQMRLADARDALAMVESTADDFAAEVAALCATTVTDRQWSAFLDEWAPVPAETGKTTRAHTLAERKREEITGLWRNDLRVAPWTGTAWGVVQAVNTYTHHVANIRGAGRAERNMTRAVTGETSTLDQTTAQTLAKILANA